MPRRLTSEEFIANAKLVHGNKYKYSKVNYIHSKEKIIIICHKHLEFLQRPDAHLSGQGCLKCERSMSQSEFLRRSILFHLDKYDYSKVIYTDARTKVIIVCKIHGNFLQTPDHHLRGNGCSRCMSRISRIETEFLDYLNISVRDYYIPEWKKKAVDGYDSKTNTVYEFLGDYWHGNPKKYDRNKIHPVIKKTFGALHDETMLKLERIKSIGYNVKYIWENDWIKFKNETGVSLNLIVV